MSSDAKEVIRIGTSSECETGRIADGLLGYLIKHLFFVLNLTVFTIQN